MQVPSMCCYVWHGWMTYSTSGGWSHWDDPWAISHYILPGLHMGLSENRVYSQWNSHLVGIMISKTIGFRGTLFSDTSTCLDHGICDKSIQIPCFWSWIAQALASRQGASPESDTPRTPSWRHFPPSIWRSLCSVRCGGQDRLISEEWCRMVKMWNVKMMTLRVYGGWNYSSWGFEKKHL